MGDLVRSRAVVAEATTRAFAPASALAGVVFLLIAVISGDPHTVPLGIVGLAVGVIGFFQKVRSRSNPMTLLMVAAVGSALSVPFLGLGEAIALLPTQIGFALLGLFLLRTRSASLLALVCLLAGIWTILWHRSEMTPREVVAAVIVFVITAVAGWRFFDRARDALTIEQENSRFLFDSSPVAILEEDYTAVKRWLEELAESGVRDLRSHLSDHPEEARMGISLIRMLHANQAAVSLIGADSVGALVDGFAKASRDEGELEGFVEQFVAIWEGRNSLALDLNGVTLDGRPLEAVLHWSVPVIQGKEDLSRVIVAISDITPRKAVEERLARAVASNERLLAFEKALTACSRALLLGVGEDALEVALQSLREAMAADRAYLTINVEDPELGHAFRVVNSASKPEFDPDEWLGRVVPWSRYPMATEPLARGEVFKHLTTGDEGEGWNRSLLSVPIFSNGQWSGNVGFINIGRRTVWSDEAVRMLQVAAPMLGNFWERELTRKRLEELVQSKDQFVASISHELRTPLSAVLGFAEELRDHTASFQPHEATEILELIAEQSRDMADMVEDLLVAARADIGTVTIHADVVYLRAQAEVAVASLGSEGDNTIEVVGGPGKAWADPTRTRQIIRNLLTNAVRYGGATVTIEATTRGGATVLTVSDDGPGLAESDWEKIFEPYVRAHERPTQPESVGLGLTVSRQLARLMGGDLTYHADGTGSVFQLTLPSEDPEAKTGTQIDEPAMVSSHRD
ncbi:MAG TPA: GAF domain-containing sensor histidine kinase [Acidimicrobiia bacterium]|nr:GAF domain-containing sensor histidine kinase [Acidimicrobiia bacterium]